MMSYVQFLFNLLSFYVLFCFLSCGYKNADIAWEGNDGSDDGSSSIAMSSRYVSMDIGRLGDRATPNPTRMPSLAGHPVGFQCCLFMKHFFVQFPIVLQNQQDKIERKVTK